MENRRIRHPCPHRRPVGDYQSAYEWGRLALAVNERFNDKKRRAKVHQQFQAHVSLWRRPLETSVQHAREACQAGLETGDYTYAGYGALTETWAALLTNQDLNGSLATARRASRCSKIKMSSLVPPQTVIMNWARASRRTMINCTIGWQFPGRDHQRVQDLASLTSTRSSRYATFGAYDRLGLPARRVVQHLGGTIWPVLWFFTASRWRPCIATPTEAAQYVPYRTDCPWDSSVCWPRTARELRLHSLLLHAETIEYLGALGGDGVIGGAIRSARAANRVRMGLANESMLLAQRTGPSRLFI
jgi:hypothetical protein